MTTFGVLRLFAVIIVALSQSTLLGCVNGPLHAKGAVSRVDLLGTSYYETKRRIGDEVHTFKGEETAYPVRLPAGQSLVRWTDAWTGEVYTTKIECLSGWLMWLISDEDCIDITSPEQHTLQLPGEPA
ncbi:MAG: hypothetical protein RL326_1746 [Pseudomonadota bacterium]